MTIIHLALIQSFTSVGLKELYKRGIIIFPFSYSVPQHCILPYTSMNTYAEDLNYKAPIEKKQIYFCKLDNMTLYPLANIQSLLLSYTLY